MAKKFFQKALSVGLSMTLCAALVAPSFAASFADLQDAVNGVNAKQKMSIFAEMEYHFSAVSIAAYIALIHHFTCRLEARQALIYQTVSGLTGENGKYNYSRAVHVYPPFLTLPVRRKSTKSYRR